MHPVGTILIIMWNLALHTCANKGDTHIQRSLSPENTSCLQSFQRCRAQVSILLEGNLFREVKNPDRARNEITPNAPVLKKWYFPFTYSTWTQKRVDSLRNPSLWELPALVTLIFHSLPFLDHHCTFLLVRWLNGWRRLKFLCIFFFCVKWFKSFNTCLVACLTDTMQNLQVKWAADS